MTAPVRVVVLNKGTVYDGWTPDERDKRPADGVHAEYWDRVVNAWERHQHALDRLIEAFERLGWLYRIAAREEFRGPEGSDLVVSLGGDGTVLAASHMTLGVPLLGVNSDPERSTGYFCGATADNVYEMLRRFQAGDLETFELARLKVTVEGREMGPPALNDVLVANANPAATSRYVLVAGKRAERQKSSGIWISTPAGSTAGIRSAGGVVLPLMGAQLQYLVREPVFSAADSYELLRGVRDLEEGISVVSLMNEGCAYIDGPFEQVALPLGATMRVSAHQPLVLLGLEPERRER